MYNIIIIKVKEKGGKIKTNDFIKTFKNSNYYLLMIKLNV